MVTHLDVNRSDVEQAAAAVRQLIEDLSSRRASLKRAT
jgi:hypothetical protein